MADLMTDHTREFGLVVGKRHQAARDIDIAARNREGVDHVAVEQREGEGLVRHFRNGMKAQCNIGDIGIEARKLFIDAELLDHLGMGVRTDLAFLCRRNDGEIGFSGRRVCGTGRKQACNGQQGSDQEESPQPGHHCSSTSICSG